MGEPDETEPDGEDEEQVVGVLQLCEVCEDKTLHVEGVCTEHRIVRRRRKRRLVPRPEPEPAPLPRRNKKRRSWWRRNRLRFFFLVVLALVVTAGFTQIEYSWQTG